MFAFGFFALSANVGLIDEVGLTPFAKDKLFLAEAADKRKLSRSKARLNWKGAIGDFGASQARVVQPDMRLQDDLRRGTSENNCRWPDRRR